jgi:hypothetical protein
MKIKTTIEVIDSNDKVVTIEVFHKDWQPNIGVDLEFEVVYDGVNPVVHPKKAPKY